MQEHVHHAHRGKRLATKISQPAYLTFKLLQLQVTNVTTTVLLPQPPVSASVLMWQQLPLLVARAETHLQGRRQGRKNASEGPQKQPQSYPYLLHVQNKTQALRLRVASGCAFRRRLVFAITKPITHTMTMKSARAEGAEAFLCTRININ